MPKEELNLERASLLIQAYQAGLIVLSEVDRRDISVILKHPLKEITP